MANGGLGEFLRTRRAVLDPEQAGLTGYGTRRRVPGLRREEVAQLAGVSTAYYIRIEQGASTNASDAVLLALARVLQLDTTETDHLFDLARRDPRKPRRRRHTEKPSPHAVAMLSSISDRPAVLLGRRNDVLAWNRLGHLLIAPHVPYEAPADPATRPALPRMLFLDPKFRGAYQDWDTEARTYVAYLRLLSGKHPDDQHLTELVGELCMKDESFAAMWASGRVGECTAGSKRLHHSLIGKVVIDFHLWVQSDNPDHRMEVYAPTDQTSADALALLGTLQSDTTTNRESVSSPLR